MKAEYITHLLVTILGVVLLGIIGFYVANVNDRMDAITETNITQWQFITKNKDLIKAEARVLDVRMTRLETMKNLQKLKLSARPSR